MKQVSLILAFGLAMVAGVLPGRAEVLPQVVERGKAATALVEVPDGSGSAFCIAASGYFVTNAHVVEGTTTVRLVLKPGEPGQKIISAHVVRTDKDRDLALLKENDPQPVTALTLGRSDSLRETMSVTAFGYPFGKELAEGQDQYPSVTVSTGHITALRRKDGALEDVQLDASLNPGNSGGPVVTDTGEVIGIVASGIEGAALNFAIPIDKLRALLAQPDITFIPAPIKSGKLHQPVEFRIGVSAYDGNESGLAVTLSLTPEGGQTRTFPAHVAGKGAFLVTAAPLPARAGPAASNSPIHYRVSVTRAGRVVAEAVGTLMIELPPGGTSSPGGSGQGGTGSASAQMPSAVSLPPLHPPAGIQDKSVLRLPGPIDDVAVGGGGRYLVLSLKSLQKLAVFDCNAGKIVHYISVDSGDYHFAAGARSLVVLLDDRKVIERWSLETFQRELVTAEPNWASARDMAMGSASNGPVVIGLRDGSTQWLNVTTLAAYHPNTQGSPYGWGGTDQFPFLFRLSPDGNLFLGWVEGLSPRTIVTATFHGDHTDFHAASVEGYAGRYYTLGADDMLVYTSVGIASLTMDPISPDEFSRYHCLPAQGGSVFLGVQGPSIAVYTTTDKRLLLTLPKLDELQGDLWNLEKQIFFVPGADLLVTIPTTRDQIIVRRFNLLSQLGQSGIDYLFVRSTPPGVFRRGRRYVYQLDVKSKRGGVRYTLDSGPPGMTVSKTGTMVWAVPSGYAGTEEHVILRVQDASGQEIYHTFRITADG